MFKFNDISAIDKKDFQTTTEFFGELFDLSFTRYIKKGLQRDYITYNEELKTIKSKIDFGTTLKKVGFKSKKFGLNFSFCCKSFSKTFIAY